LEVNAEYSSLRNASKQPVDLSGWKLKNLKNKKPAKSFPSGLQIPPEGLIKIWTGNKSIDKDNGLTDFYWKKNAWDINNYELALYDTKNIQHASSSKITATRSTSFLPSDSDPDEDKEIKERNENFG